MKIKSFAFEDEGMIPKNYTCDGANISPPLEWDSIPENTQSLALICSDPDAPMETWVHWVLFDLPPDVKNISGNVPPEKILLNGAKQGMNDFQNIGYGGPCPPSDTHRYYFKLYALNLKLNLNPGIKKADLLKAMKGHIMAECLLMGKYKRD